MKGQPQVAGLGQSGLPVFGLQIGVDRVGNTRVNRAVNLGPVFPVNFVAIVILWVVRGGDHDTAASLESLDGVGLLSHKTRRRRGEVR